MERHRRTIVALLAQALEPDGRVRPGEEDRVHLTPGQGPTFTFRLVPWSDSLPLDVFQGGGPPVAPPLWVLARSTPRERALIRERGESFVALDGAVRIQAPGILIDRMDLEPLILPPKGPRRSAFSDRASLVSRELFAGRPEAAWTVSSLAEAGGVSLSVASYAVQDLEYRDLVSVKRMGKEKRILLRNRRALVEEWSREYDWRDNHVLPVGTSVESVRRFLFRLRGELSDIRWAVTLHAGASVLATHAPVENINIYVDLSSEADLWHLARNLGWKHADGGTLRLLLPRYRNSVWDRISVIQGVPVVSSLQLILDLWNHPTSGREVAEAILNMNGPNISS